MHGVAMFTLDSDATIDGAVILGIDTFANLVIPAMIVSAQRDLRVGGFCVQYRLHDFGHD